MPGGAQGREAGHGQEWWRALAGRVPVVTDRSLIRLVNGLAVAEDLSAPRSDDFFSRLLRVLAGRDEARARLVDAHLAGAQDVLTEWAESLTRSGTITNLALLQTQRHLLQTAGLARRHDDQIQGLGAELSRLIAATRSQLTDLESRVATLEAVQELTRITEAWLARETYSGLPWLLAVTLLCCDAADRVLAPSEASGRQDQLRRALANQLCIALGASQAWFPLARLLDSTARAVPAGDRELLLALADDTSPLGRRRLRSPHLFAVWSAVVTAAQEEAGLDIGSAAMARSRSQIGSPSMTSDLRRLITCLVDEAADTAAETRLLLTRQIAAMSGTEGRDVPRHGGQRTPATISGLPLSAAGGMPYSSRLGLVLSGGGARGAYEVGVVEYLAEIGIAPAVLAGASIGALNGAIIAAAGDMATAVVRLRAAWEEICRDEPTQTPGPGAAEAGGAGRNLLERLAELAKRANAPALHRLEDVIGKWAPGPDILRGTELWVTVFPAVQGAPPGLGWLIDVVLGWLGAGADWQCVQHAGAEVHQLLLASAAFPVFLPARTVYSLPFRDGGIGNNIPVEPLAERGCREVIVVHLAQRKLWDSGTFGGLSVHEIRPRRELAEDGALNSLASLFDFSRAGFDRRRQQGYEDARYWIGRAVRVSQALREHMASISLLTASSADLDSPPEPVGPG